MVDQVKIELEGFKALADTRMRFIEWLCNKHGIDLLEESSAFEQQEFESKWEESDPHSCYDNIECGDDGNDYCSICGRMTKSVDAKEAEAEGYNYDRQNGEFELY